MASCKGTAMENIVCKFDAWNFNCCAFESNCVDFCISNLGYFYGVNVVNLCAKTEKQIYFFFFIRLWSSPAFQEFETPPKLQFCIEQRYEKLKKNPEINYNY